MPIQHFEEYGVTQGDVQYCSSEKSQYRPCILILDRPKHTLVCSTEESAGQEILNTFDLSSIALIDTAPKQKPPYCFAVHYFSKPFYFATKSWKEMDDWIQLIKESSQIQVSQSDVNPRRISVSGNYRAEVIGGNVIKVSVSRSSGEPSIDEVKPRDQLAAGAISGSSSHSSSDSAPIEAIRSGYCTKQGRVRKNWKRRYLVLDSKSLRYFKTEQERKPLKTININEITDVKISTSDPSKDNLIDVVTSYRTFYMQFDDNHQMHMWLEDLRKQTNLPVMTYL